MVESTFEKFTISDAVAGVSVRVLDDSTLPYNLQLLASPSSITFGHGTPVVSELISEVNVEKGDVEFLVLKNTGKGFLKALDRILTPFVESMPKDAEGMVDEVISSLSINYQVYAVVSNPHVLLGDSLYYRLFGGDLLAVELGLTFHPTWINNHGTPVVDGYVSLQVQALVSEANISGPNVTEKSEDLKLLKEEFWMSEFVTISKLGDRK